MWASAIASRWAVETPGAISASIRSRISPTTAPARRIFSISARDLRVTMSGRPDRVVCQRRQEAVGDLLDRGKPVDGSEGASPAVVIDDLGEGAELDRQPCPNGIGPVVGALDQFRAVDVAAAGF